MADLVFAVTKKAMTLVIPSQRPIPKGVVCRIMEDASTSAILPGMDASHYLVASNAPPFSTEVVLKLDRVSLHGFSI